MNTVLEWLLWFLPALALTVLVRFCLKKKKIKTSARIGLDAAELIFGFVFGVLMLAGPVALRPVQPLMLAFYAAFVPDAAADIIYCAVTAIAKKEKKYAVSQLICLAFTMLFFIYGTVNMQIVKPEYHTILSDKVTGEHRFVMLADVHTGGPQEFKVLESTAEKIAAEKPDFVVLCGDITDDYTTKEETRRVYGIFGTLDCPVYFIYGNHDRQAHAEYANGRQYTEEELESIIKSNGIEILCDESVRISDDFMFAGRDDRSANPDRLPAEQLGISDFDGFVAVADHQPNDAQATADAGADLMLSGHTHAGQLFPFKIFYDLFICDACGEYEYGNETLIVTAGESGWRLPFRTQSGCAFEIITVMPE